MSDRDYYEVLGLTPAADGPMVDQSYWHLARKYQSLATSNPLGYRLLDDLNEAYGVLGNTRLRREYDAFRDDVLLASGVVTAVRAKPKRRGKLGSDDERLHGLPHVHVDTWRTYVVAASIGALAIAAAWQGVNPLFVITTFAVGAVVALAPVLKRRMPAFSVSMPLMPAMPSMPSVGSVTIPDLKAPRVSLPRLGDVAGRNEPDAPLDADELRASTAAIIARWRKSMGLRAAELSASEPKEAPITTLVDIVDEERELHEDDEPINAVLDILRGARTSTAEPHEQSTLG